MRSTSHPATSPRLRDLPRLVFRYRGLITHLAVTDFRRQYQRSALGILWAVATPLATFVLYAVVFGFVLKVKAPTRMTVGDSYPVFLLTGLVPWFFLSDVVGRAPGLITEKTALVKNMGLPTTVLSLSAVLVALFHHLIAIVLVVLLVLVFGGQLATNLVLLAVPLTASVLIGLGAIWALSAFCVFLRDLGHIAGIAMQFAFFATPIIYPLTAVPEQWRWVAYVNPFYYFIESYRAVLVAPDSPVVVLMAVLLIAAFAVFYLGFRVARRFEPFIVDQL